MKDANSKPNTVVTVTLNPAIDRVIEVDDFRLGRHLQGRLVERVPAGKGINVSRSLSLLGVSSVVTGFVGREEFALYERTLRHLGITSRLVMTVGATRENITIIDPQSGTETHVRDAGFAPARADRGRLREMLGTLAKPGCLVVFSGSVPPGLKPVYVTELIDLALAQGARVAVDGPGELLRAAANRELTLIKPNRKELAVMTGRSTRDEDMLIDIGLKLSQGTQFGRRTEVVLVSCGKAGGYLFTDGVAMKGRVDLGTDRVRSTVGCGDALLAGFIAALVRPDLNRSKRTEASSSSDGPGFVHAYRLALAVATAAALQAVPGAFEPDKVNELLSRVTVETVR